MSVYDAGTGRCGASARTSTGGGVYRNTAIHIWSIGLKLALLAAGPQYWFSLMSVDLRDLLVQVLVFWPCPPRKRGTADCCRHLKPGHGGIGRVLLPPPGCGPFLDAYIVADRLATSHERLFRRGRVSGQCLQVDGSGKPAQYRQPVQRWVKTALRLAHRGAEVGGDATDIAKPLAVRRRRYGSEAGKHNDLARRQWRLLRTRAATRVPTSRSNSGRHPQA